MSVAKTTSSRQQVKRKATVEDDEHVSGGVSHRKKKRTRKTTTTTTATKGSSTTTAAASSSSATASTSRKRKSTSSNQQKGQQNDSVENHETSAKKSKSSSASEDDEEDDNSPQIFDISSRKTRTASAYRDDPNQTVKTSFSKPTRMPKGENNFLKKVISAYFRCCFLQECFNLMIIKNLATLLANYIFYKTALDPSRATHVTPPKMNQEFFSRCLSAFNSNSYGVVIPNSSMKIPKAFEASLGHLFIEFASQACRRQLNLHLVFGQSLNIVARQLITNTNETFRRRTTTILKKLIIYLFPDTTTRMSGFIANSLLEREFGIDDNKNWTTVNFRSDFAASIYKTTLEAFQAYTRKSTEAERWLYFHGELLKRDYSYMDKFDTNFQWLPLCKSSKRPHVHLNKTLLKAVFPGKLADFLRKLKKFEDPFDIFNYPRLRTYESPLAKYVHVQESHISSSSTKKKRKRTRERNQRILQKLAKKLEKFKDLFPTGKKVLSKGSKEYLRSHFEIGSQIKDNEIDWEALQNKLRWEYVLPNVEKVLKPNVLRCFGNFERVSTNGVDMSFFIHKESKESRSERLKATDLVNEDLSGKLFIGVDPGVRSLATCTYSSHLQNKTSVDGIEIFAAKRKEKPLSTRMTSKEIWHKTNIACPPLRNLRLNGQESVKRRLMEIPWAKTHYSTYPNHLQQQQSESIEQYNRNSTRFYISSSRVYFSNPCKRWKWVSYRYLQASQSAMSKRILNLALCESRQQFQTTVNEARSHIKVNRQRNRNNNNGTKIRSLLRKPWMEDLMVFKKLKNRPYVSNVCSKIVVAFGNQCRNPSIIRGHYKTSCEKLCNTLEQLVRLFDGDVVDANEYLTSQRCHRCFQPVSANHWINEDIEERPIGVLIENSLKYKRRVHGISKKILQNGIEGIDGDKLSDGRRRSKIELRSCSQCSTIFNRDVNASTNIMSQFIFNVNRLELFCNN